MVGALLWRGMLLGVLAGLLCFGFLELAGERSVEQAIAFESQHEKPATPAAAHTHPGAAAPKEEPQPELVSREVQGGIGLFVAVTVYSAAFGGFFAVAFAFAYGRMADLPPRATAAMLAALGFVSVYVVPFIKYPPNPPSVGDAETIGMRTALYFSMLALSLAAMIGAGMLRLRLQPRLGLWNAFLAAAATYLFAVTIVGLALPAINEVPEHFPAAVLWNFRLASLGVQLLLCAVFGIGFGLAAERVLANSSLPRATISGSPRRVTHS
jgi:putative cobalt transporter subunit CbtA